jgi:Polyketide cyclase / dehydrase and lipid transport
MIVDTLSVQAHVDAPPEVVYDAVSDLSRMASWSDEYIGSWRFWRGVPHAGARFVGWNRNGWHVWFTTCRIVTTDRPSCFAFESGTLGLPLARWSYRIRPARGGGSDVVEEWRDLRDSGRAGGAARLLGRVFAGASVDERVQRNEAGMRHTLERLAAELTLSAQPPLSGDR